MLNLLSASSLMHTEVVNRDDQEIGEIKELMIDLGTGRVAYAVLSFGGFMGLGDKLFAIPWALLQINTDKEHFVLNVSKDLLESADGFDKDDWPDTTDLEWNERTYAHYKQQPYWDL
jgi:sporulation protein YlmC with PRC-barrel domain